MVTVAPLSAVTEVEELKDNYANLSADEGVDDGDENLTQPGRDLPSGAPIDRRRRRRRSHDVADVLLRRQRVDEDDDLHQLRARGSQRRHQLFTAFFGLGPRTLFGLFRLADELDDVR